MEQENGWYKLFLSQVVLLDTVQSAVCSVQCAVCSMQCAVCSVQCAVASVQCTVCSMQCEAYLAAPLPVTVGGWMCLHHTQT